MGATSIRLSAAAEDLRVGKISGAVGTFAHNGPDVVAKICERLGSLEPCAGGIAGDPEGPACCVLSWPRSRDACASGLEKIALEIRHLHSTEAKEASEYFAKGQKGSSAIAPHKKNPIVSE